MLLADRSQRCRDLLQSLSYFYKERRELPLLYDLEPGGLLERLGIEPSAYRLQRQGVHDGRPGAIGTEIVSYSTSRVFGSFFRGQACDGCGEGCGVRGATYHGVTGVRALRRAWTNFSRSGTDLVSFVETQYAGYARAI